MTWRIIQEDDNIPTITITAEEYMHLRECEAECNYNKPVEPRKGHWINKQRLFINSCSAECSSCHKRSNGYVYDNGFSLVCTYYDFCPNCGSDNREVEE